MGFGLFRGIIDAREEVLVAVASDYIKLGLVRVALASTLQLAEEVLRVVPVLRIRLPDFEQVLVVYTKIRMMKN